MSSLWLHLLIFWLYQLFSIWTFVKEQTFNLFIVLLISSHLKSFIIYSCYFILLCFFICFLHFNVLILRFRSLPLSLSFFPNVSFKSRNFPHSRASAMSHKISCFLFNIIQFKMLPFSFLYVFWSDMLLNFQILGDLINIALSLTFKKF